MLQLLASLIQSTADFLFVPVLVVVLFGAGVFLTVRLGFVQVRRFGEAVRAFFTRPESGGEGVLTPCQAFMTALAATIGTGNIAGITVGIVLGGPGALFWITLTTTGFGDVTPAIPLTRTLAVFEALAGQLYLVITLARLVSQAILSPDPQGDSKE